MESESLTTLYEDMTEEELKQHLHKVRRSRETQKTSVQKAKKQRTQADKVKAAITKLTPEQMKLLKQMQ